jgi:myo-inositol-1-phosphate synthase
VVSVGLDSAIARQTSVFAGKNSTSKYEKERDQSMATKKKSAGGRKAPSKVAPAKGKLGVMVVGLGAVATTMIAGVEAVRRGLAKPVGSLTQMGTIRIGKRTDNKSPLIRNFVPLADLNDVVFTGWDIFKDNVYEAAAHA